jgi:hypothetical protein
MFQNVFSYNDPEAPISLLAMEYISPIEDKLSGIFSFLL